MPRTALSGPQAGLLAILPLLAACATAEVAAPAPQGSAVPLGEPVRAGSLIATPTRVVEDSRCPENARCVWAGRLIVRTAIAGPDWRDVVDLTLGQPYRIHGHLVALVSGLPEKQAGAEPAPAAYRFVYEAGALPAIGVSEAN